MSAKLGPSLLRFTPIYQERPWGGRAIADSLGRTLPAGKIIGESWEVVDRPEALSRVADGPWAGRTLREILEHESAAVMGPHWQPARRFPILVKWLDARERMSLQVHPPAAIAPRLGGEPKTENWYIAEAAPGAALMAGVKTGVTREAFETALRAQELEPFVHRFPTRRGESLFVPSGRLHAIDAGNLILEIQQNSDTTYRVYDWGRVGLDGKPRALHVAESLACIDFSDVEPTAYPAGFTPLVIAECEHFRIRRVPLAKDAEITFAAHEQPRLLALPEGRLATNDPVHPELERGANVLIPYNAEIKFRALVPSMVLITENFAG